MNWIDIKIEQPTIEGKYIVEAKTMMGNIHKFETIFTIENNKGKFDVSNQLVLRWLKEY